MGKQIGKPGLPADQLKDSQTNKQVVAPTRKAALCKRPGVNGRLMDGDQIRVSDVRFPIIHLSLFVSSPQQSVFLAVMKNMASVINLESASKLGGENN